MVALILPSQPFCTLVLMRYGHMVALIPSVHHVSVMCRSCDSHATHVGLVIVPISSAVCIKPRQHCVDKANSQVGLVIVM